MYITIKQKNTRRIIDPYYAAWWLEYNGRMKELHEKRCYGWIFSEIDTKTNILYLEPTYYRNGIIENCDGLYEDFIEYCKIIL